MTSIPPTFRAYVATSGDGSFERGVTVFEERDLPPGEVKIRVSWSSVNYKDGLRPGLTGRSPGTSPLTPGSTSPGRSSRVTTPPSGGCVRSRPRLRAGCSRHGGYAEYERVPADWVVPLAPACPARRDGDRDGRVHGGESVVALEERGLEPASGPVLVTEHRAESAGRRSDPGRSGLRGVGSDGQARGKRTGSAAWAPSESSNVTRSPARAGRSSRNGGRAPSMPSVGRRCRTCCGHSGSVRRSPVRATPAARTSRRRCSHSSCAAFRCSAWTRSTCRSPGAASYGSAWRPTSARATSGCIAGRSRLTASNEALDVDPRGRSARPLGRSHRGVELAGRA